jgi:outer membrane protein TolC
MKNKLIILLSFLLATGGIAHAQVSPPLQERGEVFTLQQILDSIDVRNPGLQQFALQTKAGYAMGRAAKAWEAPVAGAGVTEFPYPFSGKMNNVSETPARKMLMLRLEQMFPNFSRQRKEQAYYRSFANQHRDDRETMKNQLFTHAKMAYVDAYIAEKKLTVIGEQEKQLQLLIKIAEGRLAYNQALLPNIYKARASLNDLMSSHIRLESTTEQAAATLNSLMNRPVETTLLVDTTSDLLQQHIQILQVDSLYVLGHRSDIRHITDEIHTTELNRQVASTGAKPVFGITLDNMRMRGNASGGESSMYMYSAMAMVSIPIVPWSSKGYKSEVHSMEYEIQAMQKMRKNKALEALGAIRKDWLDLQSAHKDLQIFQTQVIPAYAKAFQANLNAFSENTGDIYETLMAWNDLTMKKMEYYDKLADLLNIRITLETEMQQY